VIAPYAEGNFGARLTRSFLNSLPESHASARLTRFQPDGRLKHLTEFTRTGENRWTSRRFSADSLQNSEK